MAQDPVTSTPTGDPKRDQLRYATGQLSRMLSFRRQYDERRAHLYRLYIGSSDRRYFPDNVTLRSNTFVPYPYSNVETIVSRVLDAFFSFEPWFEVRGRGSADEASAEAMSNVLRWMFRKADFQTKFEQLVRNIVIYGHGGMKVDWDWDFEMVMDPQPILAMQPVIDPMTGQPIVDPSTGQPAQQPVTDPSTGGPIVIGLNPVMRPVQRMCPKFIPIDIYDLLVDPDGRMIAHIVERSWGDLQREAQANPELYDPAAVAEIADVIRQRDEEHPEQIIVRIAELWDLNMKMVSTVVLTDDVEAIKYKNLRYSYRSAHYDGYRQKMFGGKSVLLYYGPFQFAHMRSPIVHTSYTKLPNEVYGLGAIETIADMTEALNRFLNMIVDNWNLGINARYGYDVNADIDHAALNQFNVPGGKVAVNGDPSKILFPLPTHTPVTGDYQILEVYRGMIEMTSGVSDFYSKAVGSPTSNSTATGITSIINESNYRFRMFIRNLETEILIPVLQMCASMVQQFLRDDVEVRITDQPVAIEKWPVVKPEQLLGNFDFELVAANYATNKVIRQRNILAWANWASQSPYFDWHNGLEEIGKIFEIRNLGKMLKSEEQVAMEQQAMLAQQAQLMLFEGMIDTEKKARLSQAKPQPAGKGKDGKPGRPRSVQMEGKLPGAGLSNDIREMAQSMGANGLGLEGMNDLKGGS